MNIFGFILAALLVILGAAALICLSSFITAFVLWISWFTHRFVSEDPTYWQWFWLCIFFGSIGGTLFKSTLSTNKS